MGDIAKRRILKNYADERIKQYCIKECSKCFVDHKTGEGKCYGKFIHKGKRYCGNGRDCEEIINFCFDDDTKEA